MMMPERRHNMNANQITILMILIAYMAVNAVIGVWMSHVSAQENASSGFLQNYFVGGRTMGGVVLAMTIIATYTSASSFLGGPGLAASWGLTQSWVAAIQIGTAFLTLGVVGKKLGIISRRIKSVTISDYLKARYKSPAVVILASLMLVVFFITQMIAQFKGGATLIQTVTGLPYISALMLFSAIVIIYTAFGGFKAVVITDTIQGFIMACGTFLLLFFVIRAGGGMDNIIEFNTANNPGWDLLGKGEFGAEIPALRPGTLLSYWVLVGVFTGRCRLYPSSEPVCHKLRPIANTEYRNAHFENSVIYRRSILTVCALWPAGKNDALWIESAYHLRINRFIPFDL